MSEGSEGLPPETVHCIKCGYQTIVFDRGDGVSIPDECPNGCTHSNGQVSVMTWGEADA